MSGLTAPPTRREVRAWALARGWDGSPRGALPDVVVSAWNKAHPDRAYTEPSRPAEKFSRTSMLAGIQRQVARRHGEAS